MNIFGRHLKGLADFRGRENRQPFWTWVAITMGTATVASMAVFIPVLLDMFDRVDRFAREHPDQVTRTVGPGSYSISVNGYHPELMPDFSGFIGMIAIVTAAIVVLLAAVVVRRLHDTGRSGWWGIMPLPFLVVAFGLMSRIFATFPAETARGDPTDQSLALFGLMMLVNFAYLGTLVTLVLFLVAAGTQGPNRYGEDPLALR